jgi:xanthine dehydrogenase accessory factor
MTVDVLREALRLTERGETAGLATLVSTRGSTPQKAGARLIASRDQRLAGTLGGGAVEAEAVHATTLAAESGHPALRDYALSSGVDDWGLACGGTMVVFVERLDRSASGWLAPALAAADGGAPVAIVTALDGAGAGSRIVVSETGVAGHFSDPAVTAAAAGLGRRALEEETSAYEALEGAQLHAESFAPPPSLIVLGAGHVGKALAGLARGLGASVTVIDDRPEYATRERFPEADRVIAAPIDEALRSLPIGPKAAIVVAMRSHDLDYEATASALRTRARYVGLMGARRKAVLVTERLVAEGLPIERVRALRAPIGLDIGARSPGEIAVSILAEWLMVRQGGTGSPMLLDAQLFEKAAGRGASP